MVKLEKGNKYKRKFFMAMMFTFISGYIDILGLVSIGGMFLSFMSGNTTRIGYFIANGNFSFAIPYLIIIFAFVFGSFIGGILKELIKKEILLIVLISDILLIILSMILYLNGLDWLTYVPLTIAMGLQNIAQVRINKIVIGKTFASGTLHALGMSLAKLLFKKEQPSTPLIYFTSWAAAFLGALIGALLFYRIGLELSLVVMLVILFLLFFWVLYLEIITKDTDILIEEN